MAALGTGQELKSAGYSLLTQCVRDGNGQGGIATNIGTAPISQSMNAKA